jgi:hypothetical protein
MALERSAVAFPRNDALVLIFDLGFARLQLAQEHDDGLQHVQRLEARDHDGLAFVLCDPLVRPAADDGGDMPGTDEGVEPHVGRIENRADGGNDGDVVAEDREVADAFGLGAHHRERGGGRGGLKTDGERT